MIIFELKLVLQDFADILNNTYALLSLDFSSLHVICSLYGSWRLNFYLNPLLLILPSGIHTFYVGFIPNDF